MPSSDPNGLLACISNASYTYDTAGRRLTSRDALNRLTSYSESLPPLVRTTTLPNNSTRIESFARDGTLVMLSGTAVHGVRSTNGIETDGGLHRFFSQESKLNADGGNTFERTKTYPDLLGRPYEVITAGGKVQYFYNAKGQLEKRIDFNAVTNLFGYNAKGEREYTAIDMNGNGQIDTNGIDRVTRTVTEYVTHDGHDFRRTSTYVWPTNNSGVFVTNSVVESRLDDLVSTVSRFGLSTTTATAYPSPRDGSRMVTITGPDGLATTNSYQDGRLLASGRWDANLTYGYDAQGRQYAITNARTGVTRFTLDNAGQITATTAPLGDPNAQTTTLYYNEMGWVTNRILPDGQSERTEYYLTGERATNWGARTYPAAYTYDYAGRPKTMTTWTDFASRAGAATTTWNYDAYRGLMTNKAYADGKGPAYTYTAASRIKTRTWARGGSPLTTTYTYNPAGELTGIDYSDTTPDVTYGYDRLGRRTNTVQGVVTTTLVLNPAGQALSEAVTGGPLGGLTLRWDYDWLGRQTNVSAWNGEAALAKTAYSYDGANGMLSSVQDETNVIEYGYSSLPMADSISFRQGLNPATVQRKFFDSLDRLRVSWASNQVAAISSAAYGYNAANQRTSLTNLDGSRWAFGYDPLGQVTGGRRYWADGGPVAGQQFEYGFDDIGNRTLAGSGGNEWGANLRYANYSANNLNQYTSRTVPGAVDVLGTANPEATVTVNNQRAGRKGEYFRAEVPLANGAGPVWAALTNLAVLNNGTNADFLTNYTASVFVPKSPEVFGYDLDGNLTNDGHWRYTWDAENRLVQMTNVAGLPLGAQRRLVFAYDAQGRRIRKTVYDRTIGGTVLEDRKFVYDGWNLLAILNGTNNAPIQSFLWGQDLSGTPTGAGGVGGLVAIRDAAQGTHFVIADGNGNVAALVNAANGTVSATYEYGPFGEVIRMTGPMAKANPFRFSTKYQDDETGLLYYGHRYYDPSTGRWLSRDPIEEEVSPNLYVFVRNRPQLRIDLFGLADTLGSDNFKATPVKPPATLPPGPTGKGVYTGLTTRKKWQFETKVNGCCPGEAGLLLVDYGAEFEYWWVGFPLENDHKKHEEHHVKDWHTVWDDFLSRAKPLTGKCLCSFQKANCYKVAIDLWLKAKLAEGIEKGAEYDYTDYGYLLDEQKYKDEWFHAKAAREKLENLALTLQAQCAKLCTGDQDDVLIPPPVE